MHLGLMRGELGQNAPQTQRFVTQGGTHPVPTAGRRVALVEDQVHDFQHRIEAGRELCAARHLEGDGGLGQRAFGAHDALRDRRLGHQEGARDLLRRQAAEQAQRERQARLGGQQRMAGREHQPQEIITDVVIERGVEIRGRVLLRRQLDADLLVLPGDPFAPAQLVDRAALGGGHQPGPRVVRNAGFGPALEGDDERVLR
jgi:hypothetical protein